MTGRRQAHRQAIAELLHAGATHAEIRQQLGAGPNIITKLRRELGITTVRRRPGRTPEASYNLYAVPYGDGHARWDGPWAGRMPQIWHKGRCISALRVAFRIHTGREPTGRVNRGCNEHACVAGAHLTDQPMRQRLTTTYAAILRRTP